MPGQTLQATALVHEAYLRLVDAVTREQAWKKPGPFFWRRGRSSAADLDDRSRRHYRRQREGLENLLRPDLAIVVVPVTPLHEV
ncbi:MAG: hypothetical protein C0485_19650 [Pirellula sp.]|nr:hypothetical protein [Pirellula sp.]